MSPSHRHPTARQLRRWADKSRSRAIAGHVASCDRCTQLLEEIAPPSSAVTAALAGLTAPPTDLEPRLATAVEDTIRDRAALEAFAELFSIGWLTGRAIIEPSPAEEEPA